eukprot:11175083-Alexandrium_andersonii.AAC.1
MSRPLPTHHAFIRSKDMSGRVHARFEHLRALFRLHQAQDLPGGSQASFGQCRAAKFQTRCIAVFARVKSCRPHRGRSLSLIHI